jgi:hypothetical protein
MQPAAHAQASTIERAQPKVAGDPDAHSRHVIDQMVTAFGGDTWRHRSTWKSSGNFGLFYKGKPGDLSALKFEEYHRSEPFATRFVVVTHIGSNIGALLGVPIGHDKRDVVQLLTADNGYEVTYRGKKELPADIVVEQQRQRAHTIDAVLSWLKEPGTTIFYEGTQTVMRRIAERISIVNASNDTVTLDIDYNTHLLMSREFRYKDPVFKDTDVDREEYDNYQLRDGIMTPLTITRFKNDDMVAQHFITEIHFNVDLNPDLFDPNVPLPGKPPKK